MKAIEVKDLRKTYKGFLKKDSIEALKGVDLEIDKGEIFGLLGPNGAGKTTFVKILLTICKPTDGKAKILGEKITKSRIRKKVGYLPEDHKFPEYLTGEDLLHFYGRLNGVKKGKIGSLIDEKLKIVKMDKWAKTKIRKYSKGMKQRLGVAQALLHDPEVLFLDEPTDGVDPIGRKEIRDILVELKKLGRTIFISSHILSELELVCERVAILNKGKLIREGTVEELTEDKNKYEIRIRGDHPPILPILKDVGELNPITENIFEIKIDSDYLPNEIIDRLRRKNVQIDGIIPKKLSLEDMFIDLIKKEDKRDEDAADN